MEHCGEPFASYIKCTGLHRNSVIQRQIQGTAKAHFPTSAISKSGLPVLRPPRACPELNSAENIWRYLGQTYLGNRVFDDYTTIFDACQCA
jgi:hypothetical protein